MEFDTRVYDSKNGKITKTRIIEFDSIINEIDDDTALYDLNYGILAPSKFNTVKAKSYDASTRCVSSDTYDEAVGIDIAENKAVLKYHRAMVKDYRSLINKLQFFIEKLNKKLKMHEEKCMKLEDDLSRIMPNEEE